MHVIHKDKARIIKAHVCIKANVLITYLLEQSSINCIVNTDQSAFRASRGKQVTVGGECKASDPGVVSHDELGPLRGVVLDSNLSLLKARADENERAGLLRDRAESLRVCNGLDLVKELEVREVVHVHLLLQNDDDPITPEPHGPHV